MFILLPNKNFIFSCSHCNPCTIFTLTSYSLYTQHRWHRGPNPPILWRNPLFCLCPIFRFQFCPTLSLFPPSLSTPTPTSTALSIPLFLWLNGRLCHIWCYYGSTHVKPWYLSTRRILMWVLHNKALRATFCKSKTAANTKFLNFFLIFAYSYFLNQRRKIVSDLSKLNSHCL